MVIARLPTLHTTDSILGWPFLVVEQILQSLERIIRNDVARKIPGNAYCMLSGPKSRLTNMYDWNKNLERSIFSGMPPLLLTAYMRLT